MFELKNFRGLIALALTLPLAGCNTVVLNPSGDVAMREGHLIVVSTILMLLIIVPVIALTVIFAWRYRQSNRQADYDPDWDHSTQLELVLWSAPLLIIIALGAYSWIYTHTLDPYQPLDRIAAGRPVPAGQKPLVIEVVALDWKWLFVYPEQGVASVNEMAAPIDVPIQFKITASSVMNSFYIPALAGQVYAMPSMQTQLYAVINKPGSYQGISANFSGDGFNDMHFTAIGVDQSGFDQWVSKAKRAGHTLDNQAYLKLVEPSEKVPVSYYSEVAPSLYEAILNRCVAAPDGACNSSMTMSGATMGGMSMDASSPSSMQAAQTSR